MAAADVPRHPDADRPGGPAAGPAEQPGQPGQPGPVPWWPEFPDAAFTGTPAQRGEATAVRPVVVAGRPRRRGRGLLVLAAMLVTAAILPGPRLWLADQLTLSMEAAGLGEASEVFVDPVTNETVPVPPRPQDAQDTPLGVAPDPPPGEGGYRFLMTRGGGEPVAFDPCRPVHVVVNDALAPPEASAQLRRALAVLSAATGLRFTLEGTTDEPASEPRQVVQLERYGDRWAPVLVSWTTPRQAPELAGDVLGVGGGQAFDAESADRARYVSGVVLLDAPAVARLPLRQRSEIVHVLLLHELGHVLGLDHVSDASQVMHDGLVDGVFTLGAGDRRGLALLGTGVCATGG